MSEADDKAAGDDAAAIEALLTAGRHGEAAAALAERGGRADLERAIAIYERLWNFRAAAALARKLGDRPRALRLALEAKDPAELAAAAAELERASPEERRAAVQLYEARRMWQEAAVLSESLGERAAAAELFGKAHLPLEQARLYEVLGRLREAGQVYEGLLAVEGGLGAGDTARAHLALGRILEGFLRHEAAVRHLQKAVPDAASGPPAERLLPLPLAGLGLREGARDALKRARRADPNLPEDVDAAIRILARELRAGQLGGAGGEGDAPAAEADAGRWLMGRYRLDHLLGSGGSGRVYRAFDAVRGIPVAVKIFSGVSSLDAKDDRGRKAYSMFLREARVLGTLRHPHVVELYDVDEAAGFLAMELMVGTLEARLRPLLPLVEVPRIIEDVLAGLEVAHQRGIVHRDLKPANIFFSAAGRAKLGDFGVAHLLDLGQTQTGGFIGSLAYMSPEQITGAKLTVAADFYALGVTLYLVLTGRLPFLGPDFAMQHLSEPPPPPSVVAALSERFDPLLARLLAKAPGDRYQTVEELRRDLSQLDWGERAAADASRPTRTGTMRIPNAPAEESRPPSEVERYVDLAPLEEPRPAHTRSHLGAARDVVLSRGVIVERFEPGVLDDTVLARLQAFARAGGAGVQRILRIDRATGLVVYERPEAAPTGRTTDTQPPEAAAARRQVRLLSTLAGALAALHRQGVVHGALTADRVVEERFGVTITIHGLAAPPASGASLAADLAAALAIAGISPEHAIPDAAALEALARSHAEALARAERERAHQAALAAQPESPR